MEGWKNGRHIKKNIQEESLTRIVNFSIFSACVQKRMFYYIKESLRVLFPVVS